MERHLHAWGCQSLSAAEINPHFAQFAHQPSRSPLAGLDCITIVDHAAWKPELRQGCPMCGKALKLQGRISLLLWLRQVIRQSSPHCVLSPETLLGAASWLAPVSLEQGVGNRLTESLNLQPQKQIKSRSLWLGTAERSSRLARQSCQAENFGLPQFR